MVRAPCIDKNGLKKGAWSEEEDNKLRGYIERYGHWNWRELPKYAGIIHHYSNQFHDLFDFIVNSLINRNNN